MKEIPYTNESENPAKALDMVIKTLAISLLFTFLTSFANPLPAGKYNFKAIPSDHSTSFESGNNSLETRLQKMDDVILAVYNELKGFENDLDINKPSFPVFKKALIGFYNLLGENKLENNKLLTVIDFTLPSDKKRLWIINLKEKQILFNDLVAHGRNSGNIMAEKFSNVAESHMSSQGFYITGNTYHGKHGLSLRLNGMEEEINHNAFDRAIVMHGAEYVSEEFIQKYGRLGRSYGCPSVSNEISKEVINTIKDKTCLFIYSPALQYDKISALLNPENAANYLVAKNFLI